MGRWRSGPHQYPRATDGRGQARRDFRRRRAGGGAAEARDLNHPDRLHFGFGPDRAGLRVEPRAARRQPYGLTSFEPSMGGKWLALLKEIAPKTRRVSVIYNPATAPSRSVPERASDRRAGLWRQDRSRTRPRRWRDRRVTAALEHGGDAALLVPSDAYTLTHAPGVIAAAAKHRLPAVCVPDLRHESARCPMASISPTRCGRRRNCHRILSGTSPNELPVQQPARFELLINLRPRRRSGFPFR